MTDDHFSSPDRVARYVEGPRRSVPGLDVLHRLVEQILAESVPDTGRVLVVGAGGGLELTHLAEAHRDWTFEGVDPSAEMLQLAQSTMGSLADRATLHEGYIDDAPEGPFDGATCLLTLHFVPVKQRLVTLTEIHRRLRPGAPLLTFHHSVPAGQQRVRWLERSARFAAGPHASRAGITESVGQLSTLLPLVTPEEDQALLRKAGFKDVGTFYAALTFRGWLAYA